MKIKNTIGIREKMAFVQLVVDNSFQEINGIKRYNNIMMHVMFDYALVLFYTDLYDINDEEENENSNREVFDIYDEIHQDRTIEKITETIFEDELDFLHDNVNSGIEVKIKEENNLITIIGSFLNRFLDEFNEEKITSLVEQFNAIDPKNKKLIENIFKQENKGRKNGSSVQNGKS